MAMISTAGIGVIAASIGAIVAVAVLALHSFDLEKHMRGENVIHGKPGDADQTDSSS